jgi:phospholipid/cholesterol/gamma-HCH transport system substrate-binding protein
MRRSVREAIVGFTLLAAVSGSAGLWFWIKGVSLASRQWTIKVSFADAAGLADRSSVTYRGVLVGRVSSIKATASAVIAELEITNPDLVLPRPVMAQVQSGSLLGGDAEVALLSAGPAPAATEPGPLAKGCATTRIVCNGGSVEGQTAPTMASVTSTLQALLDQASNEKLIPKVVATTESFQGTAKEANRFMASGQVLVTDLTAAVRKADPTLTNLNKATADAAKATAHLNSIVAALDNPKTIGDLKATASNAKTLTARFDAVGGDVNKLTSDPTFMDGVRSVAIGLGKFFDELYPAQTAGAKEKTAKEKAPQPKQARP